MSTKEPTYVKEAIISAKQFATKRDLLQVLLVDGETYTLKEVVRRITQYNKKIIS